MIARFAAFAALCALLSACGSPEPKPETYVPEVISGLYDVTGVTTTLGTSEKREISGTVILRQEGERYTAKFDLKTTYPGQPDIATDVIGTGEGDISGARLVGTAETQLVISTVPGVDPSFAFVPRMVSARLVSTSVADFRRDGTISVRIENTAAPGQKYNTTETHLKGTRYGADGRPRGSSPSPQ